MDSNNAHRMQIQHGSEPSYSLINAQTSLPSSVVATAGWKSFLAWCPQDNQSSPAAKCSRNPGAEQGQSADFYHLGVLADAAGENETMNMDAPDGTWPESRMLIDDSSLRCMLPGAGIGPSNQGLSLTLSDSTPLQDRLQQLEFHQQQPNFELKNIEDAMPHQVNMREDSPSKSFHIIQLQEQQQQYPLVQGHFFPQPSSTSASSALCSSPSQQLRDSKYLAPVQELLKEFCSLDVENSSGRGRNQMQRQVEDASSSSPTAERSRSLVHLEIVEMKKRMARLVAMLEELDARYRRYRDQMRAIVSSFESAAGKGAATVYTMLASRAMSRHFRCLRDGIVGQVSATKKVIGEDRAATGTTSGETPRLRLLDHYIRQQKALQQAGIMVAHPWRPQRGLPERSVSVLRAWLFEHFLHPYPTDVDKHILARQTGLSRSQVCNWFINARVRLWKPMVEEMYLEEAKEQEQQSTNGNLAQDCSRQTSQVKLSMHGGTSGQPQAQDDKKSGGVQIGRNPAAGSLTSVVDSSSHTLEQALILDAGYPAGQQHPHQHLLHQQVPRALENFDVVSMDFSAYNDDCGGQERFQPGVSLTLGLQQHDGAGVGLSFSPATQRNLFSSKEPNGSYPMQFSILDGDVQNRPYRNLMGLGAHHFHDLSG